MEKEIINSYQISKYADSDNKISISNKIIKCDYFDFPVYENITFKNCEFIGGSLSFRDSENKNFKKIAFYSCNLNIDVDCYFNELKSLIIKRTSWSGELEMYGIIGFFRFDNNRLKKNIDLNLNIEDVTFNYLFLNDISSTNTYNLNRCKINKTSSFKNLIFKQISITFSIFEDSFFLNDTKSNNVTILFDFCEFKKNFYFNNNQIKNLVLNDSHFNNEASLQNLETKKIKINHSFFEKTVLFDDLNITSIDECNRKTIRTIKQELQKTENRIDFDKYRSYELELYKKELKEKEKWWHGDLLILRLNSLFSNHGLSWKKAIGMTFLFSLLFYTMLYGVERFYNKFSITEISFDQYTSGYFKFFLVTNFYDPLFVSEDKNKEYLSHFLEWFFFILGKITIGYGLFETVQSFRKYKK